MKLGIVYHMPFWRNAGGALRETEGSFARYVDSLAPYFDEIVLLVPFVGEVRPGGTGVRSPNVRVAPLGDFDGPMRFYRRLPAFLAPIVAFVRDIDVLHCRVPTPAAIVAFRVARLLGRPSFVLVVGDLEALRPQMPYRGLKRLLWRAYTSFEERNVQWMADRSLTFANGAALSAKHSRPGRKVVPTQTTTIDAGDISVRSDTCTSSRIRVLTVSRIDPRKGLRVLPQVVRLLVDRGVDLALDIVGPAVGAPGEEERRHIETAARSAGLQDRVTLLGPIPLDRLMPMYRDYDIFVLPTGPGEGVPRVLLEAMAAGTPVVTTRVAGIPSLVTHEHNGLLVEQPDAARIAESIGRLLDEGALRRRLIAGGYATARKHTLDVQAARMMGEVAARLGLRLRHAAPVPAA